VNGVVALRTVLIADVALIALVPAARIAAGVMPQGTALPAISITSVSTNDLNIPNPATTRMVTERVQVTVMAGTYPEQKTILAAVKRAAADTRPTVSGIANVTIHTENTGPDFMNDGASIYLGSLDFRVIYNETR
jgi:hypothetical protein